jgi:hypothetical protein
VLFRPRKVDQLVNEFRHKCSLPCVGGEGRKAEIDGGYFGGYAKAVL